MAYVCLEHHLEYKGTKDGETLWQCSKCSYFELTYSENHGG